MSVRMPYNFRRLIKLKSRVFAIISLVAGLIGAITVVHAEAPLLAERVSADALPPEAQRLHLSPLKIDLPALGKTTGQQGGEIEILMASSKDTRMLTVYGYSRLVGFNPELELQNDIALAVDNEEDRRFTFHLRPGHRWSDGKPFTSEDFRYFWEDIANNEML